MKTTEFHEPTQTEIRAAMIRGRTERARAFRHGLSAIGTWISGGKPQAPRTTRARSA